MTVTPVRGGDQAASERAWSGDAGFRRVQTTSRLGPTSSQPCGSLPGSADRPRARLGRARGTAPGRAAAACQCCRRNRVTAATARPRRFARRGPPRRPRGHNARAPPGPRQLSTLMTRPAPHDRGPGGTGAFDSKFEAFRRTSNRDKSKYFKPRGNMIRNFFSKSSDSWMLTEVKMLICKYCKLL